METNGIRENTVSQNNSRNAANVLRNNEQFNRGSRFNETANLPEHMGPNTPSYDDNKNQNRNNTSVPGTLSNTTNRPSLDLMPGPSRTNINNSASQDDEIVCSCNNKALLLTVRKDGPNKGSLTTITNVKFEFIL